MRNCPAVMAAVHDSVAADPRAAAIDLGILVEKCVKESQVRSLARYRWLSEDDLEPWAIGSGRQSKEPVPAPAPDTRNEPSGSPVRSGTNSGVQPLKTSHSPGAMPASSQVSAVTIPSSSVPGPPPTPRFGP